MTRHETIEGINKRLGKMNKEKLERLLKFIDQKADHLSSSGLPYTGDPETDAVLDDPEVTRRILEHQKAFEGLSPQQVAKKMKQMEAKGELIPWEKVKAEMGL
jgi:hypothetical protein